MHLKLRHKKQLYILIAIILVVIVLVVLGLSMINISGSRLTVTERSKRGAIEAKYPEFKNYEFQESFAGKVTMQEEVGDDFYIAYVENGSGVPIAKATCFKVNSNFDVSLIGTFPDMMDSYAGYSTIDLRTCKGIKTDNTN